MQRTNQPSHLRRLLLRAAAAAPGMWALPSLGAALSPSTPAPDPGPSAAAQVLDVAEFEALARTKLPPAHFAYLATGNDDDLTLARNHEAYGHIQIRARRFVDVSHPDMTREVFGRRWGKPFYYSAVSGLRAFHPDAELGVARAAASRNTQLMLSTGSSTPADAVRAARGGPFWQQLYPTDDWSVTQALVRRAEGAGCDAIALTVDSMPDRNAETLARGMRRDTRDCLACHVDNSHDMVKKAPAFAGLDVSHVNWLSPTGWTWDYLKRLRDLVKVKLIIKGIVTGEDAGLVVEHGADGLVVSNHGGRQEETLRSTIECLPEIVAAVSHRIPVFIDGGIRRGTDIFKAIALGATAVGIGRPVGWGLAAFGQSGVEAVDDILVRELRNIMRQAGTPSLDSIDKAHLAWPQA